MTAPSKRHVAVTKVVGVPARAIFALLVDPAKHPLLDGSGTVVTSRGATTRLGPGARFSMDMRLGGLPYRVTNVVIEFEEGRRIAWRHALGGTWRWELEDLGDATTRVTETFDWSGTNTARIIERMGYPEKNRVGIAATLDRLEEVVARTTTSD